jgi:hypothetical protein
MIVAELKRPDMAHELAGVVIDVDFNPMRLGKLAKVNVFANERLR